MDEVTRPTRRVVLCTVSSDAHTWNLVFLQLLLEEAGFEVLNLGPCTPVPLVVDTLRTAGAGALVVSSVNGHGHRDGADLIRAVRAGGHAVPAVIGGKLGIAPEESAGHARELAASGFDAVFSDASNPRDLPSFLDRRLTVALPGPEARR